MKTSILGIKLNYATRIIPFSPIVWGAIREFRFFCFEFFVKSKYREQSKYNAKDKLEICGKYP